MSLDETIHDDHHDELSRIIAIAIDGSESSLKALDWCKILHLMLAIENVFNSKTDLVVLLNTRPNSEVGPFGATYMDAGFSAELSHQFEDSFKAQSHQVLKNAMHLLKTKGFSVKAISLKGDAREEITRKISELKANLLIVASRGMGAVKRALIGSTSDHLVHHASCPVLIYKE